MEKPPNITREGSTRRLRITPTRLEPMQFTPEGILKKQ
jgi:hypothetical protein